MGHRQHQPEQQQQLCRHYNTARGCFRGDSCQYCHIDTPKPLPNQRPPSAIFPVNSLQRVTGLLRCLLDYPPYVALPGSRRSCNGGQAFFFKHSAEPSFDASPPPRKPHPPWLPAMIRRRKMRTHTRASSASRKSQHHTASLGERACIQLQAISDLTRTMPLDGCSHSFCHECIRTWRAAGDKDHSVIMSEVIKTCPACRAPPALSPPLLNSTRQAIL